MNYEIAKSLKDAGFPQPDRDGYETFRGIYICPSKTNPDVCAYLPTLEELIEACISSGGYTGLGIGWNKENSAWTARLESKFDNPVAVGKSCIEAVARLWLALNTK